jgi:gluconokinase
MILVVAGVAGSGKTTIGRLMAARLHCEFADGDAFHSKANVAKMEAGIPLTDADRWPWLESIVAWMDERAAAGESAVVACSALRRAYRDVLLSGSAGARMVFLVVPQGDDEVRLAHRAGHFFPQALLESQFAALELPEPAEDVPLVPAEGTPEQTADRVMEAIGLQPGPTDTPSA